LSWRLNRSGRKIRATDGSGFRSGGVIRAIRATKKVPSVLLNVVAERSKIGRFVSPGKFSKEITSRKGALERVREYSGFLLIERLIISRLDAPPPKRHPKGGK
jgi:hypothetical protein